MADHAAEPRVELHHHDHLMSIPVESSEAAFKELLRTLPSCLPQLAKPRREKRGPPAADEPPAVGEPPAADEPPAAGAGGGLSTEELLNNLEEWCASHQAYVEANVEEAFNCEAIYRKTYLSLIKLYLRVPELRGKITELVTRLAADTPWAGSCYCCGSRQSFYFERHERFGRWVVEYNVPRARDNSKVRYQSPKVPALPPREREHIVHALYSLMWDDEGIGAFVLGAGDAAEFSFYLEEGSGHREFRELIITDRGVALSIFPYEGNEVVLWSLVLSFIERALDFGDIEAAG